MTIETIEKLSIQRGDFLVVKLAEDTPIYEMERAIDMLGQKLHPLGADFVVTRTPLEVGILQAGELKQLRNYFEKLQI